MLVLGEVQTGLLQHSTSLTPAHSAAALALLVGERVRRSERPVGHASSPELLTGVDCRLASASGAKTRAIGTVLSRGTITGGYVVQGSAYTRVVTSEFDRRQPWSHYLSRPGAVETIGVVDWGDLARGFAESAVSSSGGRAEPSVLDLGAISARVMDSVQAAADPDRRPPFRIGRTRLRWVVASAAPTRIHFGLDTEQVRTVTLTVADSAPTQVAELCEDLALHDWLLTTLLILIERSAIGSGDRSRVIRRLLPAIDHLLHLWMPAARLDRSIAHLWDGLEHHPGFTRQWRSLVDRVRDQIAIGTLTMHGVIAGQTVGAE